MTVPGCEKTILIVEDDADTSDAIAEVLEDGNYRPLRAPNGAAALDELRAAERAPCRKRARQDSPPIGGTSVNPAIRAARF